MHILEEYPRDELFQVDVETLYNFVMEILMLYERPRIRALARADKFDRFVSILVFIPRDKYDTDVRMRVAATSWRRSTREPLSASYVSFPEGPLARVHYIIGRYEGKTPVVERATLEAGISAIVASWGDKLTAALAASTDGMRARMLANRYAQAFTAAIPRLSAPRRRSPISPPSKSSRRSGRWRFPSTARGRGRSTRFSLKVFSRWRAAVALLSRAGDRKSRPARGQ